MLKFLPSAANTDLIVGGRIRDRAVADEGGGRRLSVNPAAALHHAALLAMVRSMNPYLIDSSLLFSRGRWVKPIEVGLGVYKNSSSYPVVLLATGRSGRRVAGPVRIL